MGAFNLLKILSTTDTANGFKKLKTLQTFETYAQLLKVLRRKTFHNQNLYKKENATSPTLLMRLHCAMKEIIEGPWTI